MAISAALQSPHCQMHCLHKSNSNSLIQLDHAAIFRYGFSATGDREWHVASCVCKTLVTNLGLPGFGFGRKLISFKFLELL